MEFADRRLINGARSWRLKLCGLCRSPVRPVVPSSHFVAERIASAFERPFVTNDDKTLTVSASVGMSLFPDEGRSASDLIRFADVSMYRSKTSMQRGAA